MKHIFNYFLLLCIAFTAAAMVACGNDGGTSDPENETPDTPTPPVETIESAKLEKTKTVVTETSVEFSVETTGFTKYAYTVAEDTGSNEAPLSSLIFATGTQGTLTDGSNVIKITTLKPSTSYIVYVAFSKENTISRFVLDVKFTTGAFEDELTFFNINYQDISAHFNFPHDKVQEGNVIKWQLMDLPTYNSFIQSDIDVFALCLKDDVYHNYITESTTWLFNEDNSYFTNNDYGTEDTLLRWFPIVPGQPMYLSMAEYAYNAEEVWWRAGWGPGYYTPLFDLDKYYEDYANSPNGILDSTPYYTGYHRRDFVMSKEPSRLKDVPEIKMELTPLGGRITLTPTDNIYGMCYCIIDSGTYFNEILPLLGNNKDYLQWYISSYHAFAVGQIARTVFGQTDIILENDYWMQQNTQYMLLVTSLSDEKGSKQSFVTKNFPLPKPTKTAPSVEVKGVEKPADEVELSGAQRHDEVYFNIKCTSGADNNAFTGQYIANYERDWAAMVQSFKKNYNMTEEEANTELVKQYGASFTAEELAAINSAEGLTIRFDTRADATTFCGAVIMNDEGVYSVASVGNYRSLKEPAAAPADMSVLNNLKDTWTATATIRYTRWHYDESRPDGDKNYQQTHEEVKTSKVVIGDVGYEATLPDEIYDIFFKSSSLKTKEEVDAVYNQFKSSVDDFNQQLINQNRILCQGFDLETTYSGYYTQYASPYELFIADGDVYSAYNYESPIFDFGPKWYLEIDTNGNVTAPFNANYFAPASQWYEYVYSFIGCSDAHSLPYVLNEKSEIVNGHFPVTISDDGNTITINPLVYGESQETYYPNIARTYVQGGQNVFQFYSQIVSPIVLTRGYSETVTPAATSAVRVESQTPATLHASEQGIARKSRTALPTNCALRKRTKVKYDILSQEEFRANINKFVENFKQKMQ